MEPRGLVAADAAQDGGAVEFCNRKKRRLICDVTRASVVRKESSAFSAMQLVALHHQEKVVRECIPTITQLRCERAPVFHRSTIILPVKFIKNVVGIFDTSRSRVRLQL